MEILAVSVRNLDSMAVDRNVLLQIYYVGVHYEGLDIDWWLMSLQGWSHAFHVLMSICHFQPSRVA